MRSGLTQPSCSRTLSQVAEGATLAAEWPWSRQRANAWFTPTQWSYGGFCAWNHDQQNRAPATRIVVTELRGVQDARAVCDECYESVLRYVGQANA
jgi:hypothetical protein